MSFPWMDSRWTDKQVPCSLCGQAIGVGEARKYNHQTKVSAHVACVGALQMHDKYTPPAAPVPPVDVVAERIERMHRENREDSAGIREAIERLKASLVETNMILSVAAEYIVKSQEARP